MRRTSSTRRGTWKTRPSCLSVGRFDTRAAAIPPTVAAPSRTRVSCPRPGHQHASTALHAAFRGSAWPPPQQAGWAAPPASWPPAPAGTRVAARVPTRASAATGDALRGYLTRAPLLGVVGTDGVSAAAARGHLRPGGGRPGPAFPTRDERTRLYTPANATTDDSGPPSQSILWARRWRSGPDGQDRADQAVGHGRRVDRRPAGHDGWVLTWQ